ncbi:tetratricopeptide repeat protein [Embleya sp. NPDC005575]|uniref:tetratricopeptide repeat protein n=1 Tax=Embleya sp. NPDC005575 TaxID=3156892 RepID=UPI0033B9592F
MTTDGDARRAGGRLAWQLAHRIELERPGASASGADVDSFQRLVDGLDSHKTFQQEGVLQHLDEAEDHFRAALAHSPGYAAAYHNLGLVYREQRRVRTDIGLEMSEAVWCGPPLMWQKAIALDPTMAPARVQLARAFIEQADRPDVDANKRSDLLKQAIQSAGSALKQPSGTHPMESALASYWLGVALLKQGRRQRQRTTRGGKPNHMVREALRLFRRAEQDLIDERARRLVREGDTTAVRPLTERIAHVVGLESECWFEFAGGACGRTRWDCVEEAERLIHMAIRWAPDVPEFHVLRGRMLLKYGDNDAARLAYLEAVQRDPQNHHARPRTSVCCSPPSQGPTARPGNRPPTSSSWRRTSIPTTPWPGSCSLWSHPTRPPPGRSRARRWPWNRVGRTCAGSSTSSGRRPKAPLLAPPAGRSASLCAGRRRGTMPARRNKQAMGYICVRAWTPSRSCAASAAERGPKCPSSPGRSDCCTHRWRR